MPKKFRSIFFIAIVITAFTAFAVFKVVDLQLSISEQAEKTQQLREQVKVLTNERAALQASIGSDIDDALILKQARSKLGLALPGERIFVDISN
ncbi:hypothetical protein FACS1894217_04280 [Clostridia bacterium]|nr:hypothetical protein FACS1894217_04280 [Clostridia bacterium]